MSCMDGRARFTDSFFTLIQEPGAVVKTSLFRSFTTPYPFEERNSQLIKGFRG